MGSLHGLVLVDDEPWVLEGIRSVFDLGKLGFELRGAFTNPVEALERLAELGPDLVVTDVRMPRMDGLELSRRIRAIRSDIEIVILSGHGEFDYAKQAIAAGISDYLLKPVKKDDFEAMLRDMDRRIAGKKRDRERAAEIEAGYESDVRNKRDLLFREMLLGLADEESLKARAAELEMGFDAESFILIKIMGRSASRSFEIPAFADRLRAEVLPGLRPLGNPVLFTSEDHAYVILDRPAADGDALAKRLSLAFGDFERRRGYELAVAVSETHGGWGDFFAADIECDEVLMEAFVSERPLGLARDRAVTSSGARFSGAELEDLMIAVSLNDRDRARAALDSIFRAAAPSGAGIDYFYSLALIIIIKLREGGAAEPVGQEPRELTIGHLRDRCRTIRELKEYVAGKVAARMERSGIAPTTVGRIVADVRRFVSENIDRDIPLKEIAGSVGVSKNYLCYIFKRETGTTLLNFIVESRVRIAKDLLRSGSLKMYEIAEAVGYADYAYFSQLFKKHTGLTLTEYRNSAR